jgi:NAD(P)-dependent dehydrogenase (short-subunit alcohol dehydrogenase family)
MASLCKTVFCKDLFSGKVAVVTGGGTGIGKAITKELARLGCKVVIASRKLERLEEAAAEINKDVGVAGHVDLAGSVFSYQCNIRNEGQVATTCMMQFPI